MLRQTKEWRSNLSFFTIIIIIKGNDVIAAMHPEKEEHK
jgi:hypothetical protein